VPQQTSLKPRKPSRKMTKPVVRKQVPFPQLLGSLDPWCPGSFALSTMAGSYRSKHPAQALAGRDFVPDEIFVFDSDVVGDLKLGRRDLSLLLRIVDTVDSTGRIATKTEVTNPSNFSFPSSHCTGTVHCALYQRRKGLSSSPVVSAGRTALYANSFAHPGGVRPHHTIRGAKPEGPKSLA
jgi:hypothetical protein